jgi:protocatechuate 3,4-dioxygenase, beta subunit
MKNLLTILCLICFIATSHSLIAQDYASVLDNVSYKKRSPVYDYSEQQLSNTDTIPDFDTKSNKLKITGTIYESDGKTPASDVILYVFQPDENGNYELKRDDLRKRYVSHRGWVKTNADGKYTIYTFMPGKYIRSKELKQIHRIIKEPGKPEYELNSFFFNDDPLIPDLTLSCRAQAVKSMLRIEKEGTMFVATKDIILEKSNSTIE